MNIVYSLNDPLNLRGMIDIVIDHVRSEGAPDTQPRTLSGFIEALLYNISFSDKTSKEWGDSLLKILSGNLHYIKAEPLVTAITTGKLDAQLLQNSQEIATSIDASPNSENLYFRLLRQTSKRFFSESEIDSLVRCQMNGNYASFLLILVKHGFASLYNLPSFFAERVFDEALTYDHDSPLRFSLMREAALNGNRNAALEYGNYLAKSEPYRGGSYEEAFEYMLMAAPLSPAIWSMAYLIQKRWVGLKQVRQFKNVLKIEERLTKSKELTPFLDELDQLECNDNDPALAEAYITSYKAYFYLAYRGFVKAFNSMAILLEKGMLGFSGPEGKEKAEKLRNKYSRAAIAGGNVTAISNEGNRLRREREHNGLYDQSSNEEQYMQELLTVAADAGLMHACFYLGNYYEYATSKGATNISRKEILQIYKRAEEFDLGGTGLKGKLFFHMAKLAEDKDSQAQYYEKALAAGLSDAAYSLALCLCEKYDSDPKSLYLLKALKYLDDNTSFMTAACREKAVVLQPVISELLQRT